MEEEYLLGISSVTMQKSAVSTTCVNLSEDVKNTIFYQHRQLRFGMTAYTTSYKQANIDTSA